MCKLENQNFSDIIIDYLFEIYFYVFIKLLVSSYNFYTKLLSLS